MDQKIIEEKVKKIFLEVFQDLDKDNFDLNKKQEEFENWDSLAHIELISKIEHNFDMKLELNETLGLDSAIAFINLLKKKLINNHS